MITPFLLLSKREKNTYLDRKSFGEGVILLLLLLYVPSVFGTVVLRASSL